jgi:hypothetical protein
VDRLVFEIEIDPPRRGEREDMQMRVRGPIRVGLDAEDRLVAPVPRTVVPTTVR